MYMPSKPDSRALTHTHACKRDFLHTFTADINHPDMQFMTHTTCRYGQGKYVFTGTVHICEVCQHDNIVRCKHNIIHLLVKYSRTVKTWTPGSVNSEVGLIGFPPHEFNVRVEQALSHCLSFLPNAPFVPTPISQRSKLERHCHRFVQYILAWLHCTESLITLHVICLKISMQSHESTWMEWRQLIVSFARWRR